MIGIFIFGPFLTFLMVANLYYTQCMFSDEMVQGIWASFCGDGVINCQVHRDGIYYLRAIFTALLVWQALIEIYQMQHDGFKDWFE